MTRLQKTIEAVEGPGHDGLGCRWWSRIEELEEEKEEWQDCKGKG